MSEKIIATRKEFLEWNSILKNAVPTSETSVDYREVCFIFRDKVEKHILVPAREIFKQDDETTSALKERSKELYEAGLPLAEVAPATPNADYKINPEKADEWNAIVNSINLKYADVLEKERKTDLEFEEWCSKKIQLVIDKIELSKMPSFDSSTFYKVAKIICKELPKDDEDGVEVE